MGVDVDHARDDELAARIYHFRGAVGRKVSPDRCDAAIGDRHVADRVDPGPGIDDTPALDDQIVGRREHVRNAGEYRSAGGGCAESLAPGQHGQSPSRTSFGTFGK